MSTALISAIRDLGEMYKALRSHKSSAELQQKVSVLERQISHEFKSLSASSMINNIPTCRGGVGASTTLKHHHPLTYSNSLAVQSSAVPNRNLFPSNGEHKKLDRSMSEPVDRYSQQPRPVQNDSRSRYKTELCRPFEESGTCKYGDKCQFAHGMNELRPLPRHPKYKTELCRTFHTTGLCPYGPRCHFVHNDFNRSLSNGLPTGNINILPVSARVSIVGSPVPMKDLEIGSLGSAGDVSPNSSSISGSPLSSSGFYMDDAMKMSPVPSVPQTAPPVMSSNTMFFGPDFVGFDNAVASIPQSFQQVILTSEQNFSPQVDIDMINNQMDNLRLSNNSPGPGIDGNRNIRLPIFNRFAFGCSD